MCQRFYPLETREISSRSPRLKCRWSTVQRLNCGFRLFLKCFHQIGGVNESERKREISPGERFAGSNEGGGGPQVVRPVSVTDLATQLAIDCTARAFFCLLFFTLPVCQPALHKGDGRGGGIFSQTTDTVSRYPLIT